MMIQTKGINKIQRITKGVNKLQRMREIVKEELRHIPRGCPPQNIFRTIYWSERMHSLKVGGSKRTILKKCIRLMREEYKGKYQDCEFYPEYDSKFFGGKISEKSL